jgi:hypothetical protein
MAWSGEARRGPAGQGKAVLAGQGLAGQGKARRGVLSERMAPLFLSYPVDFHGCPAIDRNP